MILYELLPNAVGFQTVCVKSQYTWKLAHIARLTRAKELLPGSFTTLELLNILEFTGISQCCDNSRYWHIFGDFLEIGLAEDHKTVQNCRMCWGLLYILINV